MNCPRCFTTDLVERDRTGVRIDVCPACRGVWLDRGELEKLIERSTHQKKFDDDDHDDGDRNRDRRRRSSIWDIFD